MSDLGELYRWLKTERKRKTLKKGKGCEIDGRSCVNFSNCVFEGHNQIGKFTILNHCMLGYASYVAESSMLENTLIGKFSAIGSYVRIISGRHPSRGFVSIHPAFYSTSKQAGFTYVNENKYEEFKYVDVENKWYVKIGSDVWIGNGVSIMEGVTIADGTIIGAGAVVVKDTNPYSIVGGNPAKVIRYRFDKDDIDFLMTIKWWDWDIERVKKYAENFISMENLKEALLSEG